MNPFAKIAFLILVCATRLVAIAQPCTPDVNFPASQGTLPDLLTEAMAGASYTQVIQWKAPTDTDVIRLGQPIHFKVDSMRIIGVVGLPAGISYECHQPSCMVIGGGVGCVLVSGTTEEIGQFPIKVVVKAIGRLGTPPIIPTAQVDTNRKYTLIVNAKTGMEKVVNANQRITIYPNPATSSITISTPSAESGNIRILDVSGRIIRNQDVVFQQKESVIDVSEYPKGVYLVEYTTPNFLSRGRFLVR